MRAKLASLLLFFSLFPLVSHAAAIHDAARKDDVAAITAALDSGANANEIDGLVTPLYITATRGNVETTLLLIKRGADVRLAIKFGTPLYGAAKFGHADVVAVLLAHGAKPNVPTKTLTALQAAAEVGCLDCVGLLVEAGADVNVLTVDREPAIHLARRNGHDDVATYLLSHGAETLAVSSIHGQLTNADPQIGMKLFKDNCADCHILSKTVNNSFGAPIWGIVGRKKAADGKFQYSPAMREESGSWTYEELNRFISDPARAVPGTAMKSVGLQDLKQRADLIAYLRTLSDNPVALPMP